MARLLAFSPGACTEILGSEALEALSPGRGKVCWLDLRPSPDPEELQAAGSRLGIHDEALEDAIHVHPRPKFDEYDGFYTLILPSLGYDAGLKVGQVTIYFGKHFVLTISPERTPGFEMSAERLRRGSGGLRRAGASGLLHALIDGVMDAYVPALSHLDGRLGEVEAVLDSRHPERATPALRALRQDLIRAHGLLLSLEEALTQLYADREDHIPENQQARFRNLLDHAARAVERAEHLREAAADLLHLQHAALAQRTNEAMQVLTVFSAIFMPLSFIAGVYGMNFETNHPANMPELRWALGYPAVLVLMLAVTLGLLVFFRRRGWLGAGLFWRTKTRLRQRPRGGEPPGEAEPEDEDEA